MPPSTTTTNPPLTTVSQYIQHTLRIAIAQLLQTNGYTSIQHSAMATLVDCTQRYVEEIGLEMKVTSELAGRRASHIVDAINALDKVGVDLDDLAQWIEGSEALPFIHALPQVPAARPVIKFEPQLITTPADTINAGDDVSKRQQKHIPSHLPKLPDRRNWSQTPITQALPSPSADTRKRKYQQNELISDAITKLHRQASVGRRQNDGQQASSDNTNAHLQPNGDATPAADNANSTNAWEATVALTTLNHQASNHDFSDDVSEDEFVPINPFLAPILKAPKPQPQQQHASPTKRTVNNASAANNVNTSPAYTMSRSHSILSSASTEFQHQPSHLNSAATQPTTNNNTLPLPLPQPSATSSAPPVQPATTPAATSTAAVTESSAGTATGQNDDEIDI